MKKTTVERVYSAKVTELLNQGWHIHTSTMPGHQGEIAHIDLTDGSEIRRVLLSRESVWGDELGSFHGHAVTITVGRNTDRIRPGWDSTLWNNHLEVYSQIKLAEIQEPSCRHPEGWYTDMATAEIIGCIRRRRWEAKHIDSRRELGAAYKSIALRWLRKQPRMKTTKPEDISRMTRYTTGDGRIGYEIDAKGKSYALHA